MIRTGLTIATTIVISAVFAPLPFSSSACHRKPAQGSDLARRVISSPDGLVKMTYASRDGICGDGRSFIGDATSSARGLDVWFSDGMSLSTSMGDLGARCTRGPVRLLLVVRDHRVVDVQPFVGPSSPATERPGTDFGTVSVQDVSRYMLDLAANGRDDTARNAMLAASIADSVRIATPLATIARNKSLATSVREQALRWLGRVATHEGDRDAMRVAHTILEDRDDQTDVRERAIRVIGEEEDAGASYLRSVYPRLDETALRDRIIKVVGENGSKADLDWIRGIALDRAERSSIRERAVRVIGEASDSRGLRELYDRLDDPALRERVIRTMAEIGDGDSRRWLREIVERRTESSSVRERAIRALAELGDLAYLRSAYRTLDDEGLRERVVRSVAEGGGSEAMTWLRAIVRDPKESSGLRDRAVRSLAESGAQTSELVALYDAVTDRGVRERLVSLLAERGDRAARDKLRSIATDDPDEDLRRRATRKLAENK
jgi:HEAT repeat protein